jgi:anti-sigma factor RsiW
MSSCSGFREKIHLYVDAELTAGETLELERHLVECCECNAEYQQLRAVVDAVRGAKPLYEASERSFLRAQEIVARYRSPASRVWLRIAATVLVTAGVSTLVALWLSSRASQPFAAFAADAHLRYASGAMVLDVVSTDPETVSRWLRARLPFHLDLPDYPLDPGQQKRYRLVGARLLQYLNDDAGYLAYEMNGKPISLLLTSRPEATPSGGDVYHSGRLAFHFTYHKGLKVISWTDHGLHYSLVSDISARGAESCVICHDRGEDRRVIEGLRPHTQKR